LIETYWGQPMTFVVSVKGDTQEFTTIEQARHWLRRKWPIVNKERDRALAQVDAAMQCLTTVSVARRAFLSAAKTAGFKLVGHDAGSAGSHCTH